MPTYSELGRYGKPHSMMYTVAVRWATPAADASANVSPTGIGSSLQEAEEDAARRALSLPGMLSSDQPHNAANYKGRLLELNARKHWAATLERAFSPLKPSPPALHAVSLRVAPTGGAPLTTRGEGRGKRDAEQQASKRMLKELVRVGALAPSDVADLPGVL